MLRKYIVIMYKIRQINLVKKTKMPKIYRYVASCALKALETTCGNIFKNAVHLQRRGQSGIICL